MMNLYESILEASFEVRQFHDLEYFTDHERICQELDLPFSVNSLGQVEGAEELAELYTGDYIIKLLAVDEKGTLYTVGLATGYPRVDEFIYSEK